MGASPARASFCEPHVGLCGGRILQRVSAWLPIPAHPRCSWSKRSHFQSPLAPSGRAARLWAHLAQGVPCLSFPFSRNHSVPAAAAAGMPTRPCSQQAELWGCAGTERGRAHACARGSCLSCSVPAPGARGEARRLCRTPTRAPRGAGPLPARRACTQQPARRRGSARLGRFLRPHRTARAAARSHGRAQERAQAAAGEALLPAPPPRLPACPQAVSGGREDTEGPGSELPGHGQRRGASVSALRQAGKGVRKAAAKRCSPCSGLDTSLPGVFPLTKDLGELEMRCGALQRAMAAQAPLQQGGQARAAEAGQVGARWSRRFPELPLGSSP